jgi:hypothetical protein
MLCRYPLFFAKELMQARRSGLVGRARHEKLLQVLNVLSCLIFSEPLLQKYLADWQTNICKNEGVISSPSDISSGH